MVCTMVCRHEKSGLRVPRFVVGEGRFFIGWCPRWDSNPHSVKNRILSFHPEVMRVLLVALWPLFPGVNGFEIYRVMGGYLA